MLHNVHQGDSLWHIVSQVSGIVSCHYLNWLKISSNGSSLMFPPTNVPTSCILPNESSQDGRYCIFALSLHWSTLVQSPVLQQAYPTTQIPSEWSEFLSCCIVTKQQWWEFEISRLGNLLPPTSPLRPLKAAMVVAGSHQALFWSLLSHLRHRVPEVWLWYHKQHPLHWEDCSVYLFRKQSLNEKHPWTHYLPLVWYTQVPND